MLSAAQRNQMTYIKENPKNYNTFRTRLTYILKECPKNTQYIILSFDDGTYTTYTNLQYIHSDYDTQKIYNIVDITEFFFTQYQKTSTHIIICVAQHTQKL